MNASVENASPAIGDSLMTGEAGKSEVIASKSNKAGGDTGSSASRTFLRRYFVVLLLPALLILFSILAPSTFLTAYNFQTILTTNAVLIILAIASSF